MFQFNFPLRFHLLWGGILFISLGIHGCLPTENNYLAYGTSMSIKPDAKRPNILFMIADDLTHRDIGCYGNNIIKTPNIDQLAEGGMRFTRAFQAAPMCSPTRHCLYTGLYPVKSEAYPNHAYAKEGTESIAQYLQALGYRVGLTGKTHIAPKESFPFEYIDFKPNAPTGTFDWEAVAEFVNRDDQQPFCLFVCSKEPHSPWDKGDPSQYELEDIELPPYLVDTEETRIAMRHYYGEITFLDGQLGKCLDILEEGGKTASTLSIFTSEQGNSFPFAKWTCYESGLQTAFIAKWPGEIEAGSQSDAMIEYVDVVPTLVEFAGGDEILGLDGKSFASVLSGFKDTHKEYVYGIQTSRGINSGPETFGIRSVRGERYKYILNLSPEVKFTNNITEVKDSATAFYWTTWLAKAEEDEFAAQQVQHFQFRPAEELYDLKEDPFEMNNLAEDSDYESIKLTLSDKLHQWMADQGDLGQETEALAHEHQTKFLKKGGKKAN